MKLSTLFERIGVMALGGVVGGLLGILLPVAAAYYLIATGVDQTEAAALSFVPIFSLPLGMVSGAIVGFGLSIRKNPSFKVDVFNGVIEKNDAEKA